MTEAEAGLPGLPPLDPTSSLIQLLNLGELEGGGLGRRIPGSRRAARWLGERPSTRPRLR